MGDITTVEADAIVNAANTSLRGGGGVDGAIHRAAGPQLKHECITRFPEGTETGAAILTKAYNLPAKNVIHTVGPKYYEYESRVERAQELLSSCYRRSLSLAHANGLTSIAFPSISTGIYGYPIEEATKIALEQTRSFLETPEGQNFQRVIFVVFSEEDFAVYRDALPEYFPPSPSDTVSDVANP
ncbi:hypothetical protein BS47DRAFT_912331 [Hydnum rufescens UP504]|uniref:Macro domain-containing protein n=1 Tax=Hydnum rufescens UP504 TaxID=1448309 RepID=A0A9P6DT50_9AGAM|nr:hypothetical protein BS47DRAFT_912331 [Hydnum rufescens UP504]